MLESKKRYGGIFPLKYNINDHTDLLSKAHDNINNFEASVLDESCCEIRWAVAFSSKIKIIQFDVAKICII